MAINYSDGTKTEEHIRAILKHAENLSSEALIGETEYRQWAVEYHLCPERANLLRPFNFSELDVLEIGAGMGAVSRLLAEKAKHLTVIEGTDLRFRSLKERLRDLANWTGYVGNFIDIKIDKKFDVVVIIGVLEYAELFIPPESVIEISPFERFLLASASFLKPDGVLILAIENRIGLKYWSGIGEDHLGTQFDGICGYPNASTPKTFSKKELGDLFQTAGFDFLEWFYPYPDYKIPNVILSQTLIDNFSEAAVALGSSRPSRDYINSKIKRLFPEILAQYGISRAGLLDEFSNSFLVMAKQSCRDRISDHILSRYRNGEIAWYFSIRRKIPIETIFINTEKNKLSVSKRLLGTKSSTRVTLTTPKLNLIWQPSENESYCHGTQFLEAWYREGYFNGMEASLSLLRRFIKWSLTYWKIDQETLSLPGMSIDAVATNSALKEDGFTLFDLEWQSSDPVPISWFILRNFICLSPHKSVLYANSIKPIKLKNLYLTFCQELHIHPDLKLDIERETLFQSMTYDLSPLDVLPRIQRELDNKTPTTEYFYKNKSENLNFFARKNKIIKILNAAKRSFIFNSKT